MAAEYLPGIIGLIIIIVVCTIVIIIATKLEAKLKNKEKKNETPDNFTVGRIYQMEDGSYAKYIGNGKFKKVKEMD